jgi:hypothetical protein
MKKPITGITGCCAPDASGHAAAAPASSVMNLRRFMHDMGGSPAAAAILRTLSLPRAPWRVLEAELNCSESIGVARRLPQHRFNISASRPSGEWNEGDYDVLADSAVVGRIMRLVNAASLANSVERTLLRCVSRWLAFEPRQE